jgi:hypothetical protein
LISAYSFSSVASRDLPRFLAEGRTDAADLSKRLDAPRSPAKYLLEHGLGRDGEGRLALDPLPPPRPQLVKPLFVTRLTEVSGVERSTE